MKRAIAKKMQLITYDSDAPCRTCSTVLRYVSTGACVECKKAKTRALPKPKQCLPLDKLPPTREAAFEIGSKHYFTGAPCAHGHRMRRVTRTGACIQCVRAAAEKARGGTPDGMMRAAGLVKASYWVYPYMLDRMHQTREALFAEHAQRHPVEPPVKVRYPVPIMPGQNRQVDDYDMN